MASEEKDKTAIGYICFSFREGNNIPSGFCYTTEQKDIEEWRKSVNDNTQSEAKKSETEENPKFEIDVNLQNLLDRLSSSLSAFYPLIASSAAMAPLMRMLALNQHIYIPIKEKCNLIDEEGGFQTYQINNISHFVDFQQGNELLEEMKAGLDVLPSSNLMALVATFDSFVIDVMRVMMKLRPERLQNSNKTITVKDIFTMASFDDVLNRCIEDEIDATMRGSHENQIEYIEKNFNVSIKEYHERWSAFIEIFERRNLAAHGNLTINKVYVKNCSDAGQKITSESIGRKLSLSPAYLAKSVDILMETGALIIFVLWRKQHKENCDEIYAKYNEFSYNLILKKRYLVASRLLDFALYKQKPNASDRTIKMMTINAANAFKKLKDEKRFNEIMKTDFSALSNEFQISVASLKEDIDRVVQLLPTVARDECISAPEFRSWPVFDWIRSNDRVRDALEAAYGEPLILSRTQLESESDNEKPSKPSVETVH